MEYESREPPRGADGDHSGRAADYLDDLIVGYVERLVGGETVDPEEIAAEHPDLAEEILAHLRSYMDVLADPSADSLLRTFGDYTVRREIGRGGMGVVYDAWQNSMDRRVALKVLPTRISADARACGRFIREAQAAGRLNHPGVVQVYGLGIEQKMPYYAMEFVEGETLARILARLRDAAPEAETPFGRRDDVRYYVNLAEAFAAAADGLQHAHSRGVVHRDIKPSNLILDLGIAETTLLPDSVQGDAAANTGGLRLRVLDFGLARIEGLESLTGSGDLVGTPLYMSPEQAQARKVSVDHRTDIYSLGVSLYEMLTWRPPFKGKDHRDTLSQIVERDPVEPRRLNLRIPEDLETIVLQCLRKNPRERYGTAEALGQDLRRFVRGDPIEARAQGPLQKLLRRAMRYKVKFAVGAFLALLLVALAIVGWKQVSYGRRWDREEHDRFVREAAVKISASEIVLSGRRMAEAGLGLRHKIFMPLFDPAEFRRLLSSADGSNPLTQALDLLARADGLHEGTPEVHYFRARAFLLLDLLEDATEELELARRLDPSFVPALALRIELLGDADADGALSGEALGGDAPPWARLWLEAHRASRDGRWAEAAAAYRRLVDAIEEKEPYIGATIEAYLASGIAHLNASQSSEAVRDFVLAEDRSWHEGKGFFLEPYLLEAKAWYLAGDPDTAESVFRELHDAAQNRDEATLWIAATYLSLDAHEDALRWVDSLQPGPRWEAIFQRLRALILYDENRFEEASEAAQRALDLAPDDALTMTLLGWTLALQNDKKDRLIERREDLSSKAVKLDPENPYVLILRVIDLADQRRIEEGLQSYREAVRHGLNPLKSWHVLGVFCLRAGDLRSAESAFLKAIGLVPRKDGSPAAVGEILAGDFGGTLRMLGRADEAIPWYQAAWNANPRSQRTAAGLLLSYSGKGDHATALQYIEEYAKLNPSDRAGYHAAMGYTLYQLDEIDEARKHLLQWEEASRDSRHLFSVGATLLAELRRGDGDLAGAIRVLERLGPSEQRPTSIAQTMAALRHEALPDIPTLATADWALAELDRDGPPSPERDQKLLDDFRAIAGEGAEARIAYLEGRVRQRAGKLGEATEWFREAARLDGSRPEPWLRLGECLFASDKPAQAEQELLGAIEKMDEEWGADAILGYWIEESFRAGRAPEELLAHLPERAKGVAADLRWLLEKLVAGKPIRINCGGPEYTSSTAVVWGADRFQARGVRRIRILDPKEPVGGPQVSPLDFRVLEIDATEDDPIYRAQRAILGRSPGALYRIPLPRGTYRVTLHFSETGWDQSCKRVFDVVLEGETVRPDYDPGARGFARAETISWEGRVDDAHLDLELRLKKDHATIAGIEIEMIP